jgi:hypothetical protein
MNADYKNSKEQLSKKILETGKRNSGYGTREQYHF